MQVILCSVLFKFLEVKLPNEPSVRPSVGRSVGWSVGWLVCRSVGWSVIISLKGQELSLLSLNALLGAIVLCFVYIILMRNFQK